MKKYYLSIILAVLVVIVLMLALVPLPALGPQSPAVEIIRDRLVVLLFISFLLERSLTVILSGIRGPGLIDLKNEVLKFHNEIEWLKKDNDLDKAARTARFDSAMDNHHKARSALTDYTSVTRKHFLQISLIAGLTISLAGLRTFPSLFSFSGFHEVQVFLIRFIDILLTGGVIAGGSKGISSIFESFFSVINKDGEK